jgi:hypothetical protein
MMNETLFGALMLIGLVALHGRHIPIVSNGNLLDFWKSSDGRDVASKLAFLSSLAWTALVFVSLPLALVGAGVLFLVHILLALRTRPVE